MKRKGYVWVAVLVLGLVTPAAAQSSLELVGFGMIQPTPDVVSQGIGGITTVPGGAEEWLYAAPSTWHQIRATQLHVALAAGETRMGDLGTYNRAGPQNFQFLIHANRRTCYGIGIQPVTRVDMTVTDTDSVMLFSETLRYETNRSFEGGLSAFSIGFSRRIRPAVSLGVSLDILFGSLTQGDTLLFLDVGNRDDLFNMVAERRLEFSGQRLALSLLAAIPPKSKGWLGIKAVLPLTLKLIEVQNYYGLSRFNRLRHGGVGSPASIVVGYGMDIARKHRVMAEAGFSRLLKAAKNDMVFGQHLKETRSLRVGWSRIPSGDEALFMGRLYYRMGFYRKVYYLSALKNDPLAEFAFSAGIGFRSRGFGHRVDFAIQIGRRDGLLADRQIEDFYQLSVGVTTAELWFMRPNKRWD